MALKLLSRLRERERGGHYNSRMKGREEFILTALNDLLGTSVSGDISVSLHKKQVKSFSNR